MRRLKHNFKKGMAFVLTFAMIAGLVPAIMAEQIRCRLQPVPEQNQALPHMLRRTS